MQIVILGAGAIGTLFAYRFARAGHDVTLIARGGRLGALRRSQGVLRVKALAGGATDDVRITVRDELDATATPDLLLVTVRRQHADELLDTVARSNARRIMFMFNAADGLSRFRDAVGRERFSWGFPAAIARLEDDVLSWAVVPAWLRALQITTIGGLRDFEPPGLAELQSLFVEAQVPCVTCVDMESWLRTHAAFMAPLIACGLLSRARALPLRDASLVARAMRDGFRLVRRGGSRVTPWNMAVFSHVPAFMTGVVLWLAFHLAGVRASVGGEHARGEVLAMLDDLRALSANDSSNLSLLRSAVES
ncbi:MAG: ketopantoate reductase family protein [Polyangiales bacterium]